MRLKRYMFASIVLMGLVGWYVNAFISQDITNLEFFGVHLPPMPVAIWVVLPMFILFICSLFHMIFYSVAGSFKLRAYRKDYDKLVVAISDAYLGKVHNNPSFKTERYKLLGSLLCGSKIVPSEKLFVSGDSHVDRALEILRDVENGDVVDLSKYYLLPTNPLVIDNQFNRYKKGDVTAESILNDKTRYTAQHKKVAYNDLIEVGTLDTIKKHKEFMSKDTLCTIISRINAEDNALDISNEQLMELMNSVDLTEQDYIDISAILANNMIPDQRLKLFEKLSEKDETALSAYIYTLYDVEMIELANEVLDNSQANDFLKFKAYRALKEANKHFDIKLFV
ncbi:MAG: hypothetical protein U9P71_08815 [Campylobacterota bacterium]|nr:hypothetical protein [Campylobacterota bacterium]